MEDILINIDSRYRNLFFYPLEGKFRIDFEKPYKNIISLELLSFEINNSIINGLNFNLFTNVKNNNWFTIYLPNKLNDPDGIKIILSNNIQNNINYIINDINNSFLNINNGNILKTEKYFYFFYLYENVYISINDLILIINTGFYTIYGFVLQIQNFLNLNNITKNFTIQNFNLIIWDIRYTSNKRIDNIVFNRKFTNFNDFKYSFYSHYINIEANFDIYSSNFNSGILFNILDMHNTIYNNSNNIYNLSINLPNNGGNPPLPTTNIIYIENKINLQINLQNKNEIFTFEIDFDVNSINQQNNIVNINNISYPSLGYCLGYRIPQKTNSNLFFYSSSYKSKFNSQTIYADRVFNLHNNNYAFLKINDWGNIDLFNNKILSKIYFTHFVAQSKLEGFVRNEYKFRQPINIQRLDIELLDFLANIYDLNGLDYSFTIKLKQILNYDQKIKYESNDLVFEYLNNKN